MSEDQYWKDFITGRSLKKYKVKTVQTFMLDRWQVEDVYQPKHDTKTRHESKNE